MPLVVSLRTDPGPDAQVGGQSEARWRVPVRSQPCCIEHPSIHGGWSGLTGSEWSRLLTSPVTDGQIATSAVLGNLGQDYRGPPGGG